MHVESVIRFSMQGMQAIYLICPNMNPDEVAIGKLFIRNCSNPLHSECRIGSVGFPLPGVEVRVTDSETGEFLLAKESEANPQLSRFNKIIRVFIFLNPLNI